MSLLADSDASVRTSPIAVLLAPGLAAIRLYWRPFVLIQATALAVVFGYYHSPAIAAACDRLSVFKQRGGLRLSALSAAFTGAILPELAKALVLGDLNVTRQRLRDVGFAVAVFAVIGVVNDLQYRGVALLFGNDHRMATVVKKVLFDQFVTTPIYGTPYWSVVYAIRADRYRFWLTIPRLTPAWYLRTVTPLLVTGWAYWIVMITLLYAMPGPLQFCLFLFALAAWSLLMVAIAGRAGPTTPTAA
jgi:hypothetical protein